MEMIERALILKQLKEKNVPIYTGTRVTRVDGGQVTLEKKDGSAEVLEGVDLIVVAKGMRPFVPLAAELEGKRWGLSFIKLDPVAAYNCIVDTVRRDFKSHAYPVFFYFNMKPCFRKRV
jgi:pyruvate/2-oxoglutarate dehydrogenase complex dihydrolipoamide dehydrogenase (E3) component